MQAWGSIQKTLDWIEQNLSEHITIEELAEIASLSPFYYQRLFRRLVGKPVMEYVKLRRLANAADHLVKNHDRIIDIAFGFGFENHETFTRAFKDAYGMTPEEYRTTPRPLSHFIMPDLSLNYYLVDENVPLAANDIILEVRREYLDTARLFTGLTVQNPVSDTPGIDFLSELWTRFHREKQMIQNLSSNGPEAGAAYPGKTKGNFTYFAGAEVSDNEIQQGFTQWIMPSGEYAVCEFEAENFHSLTTIALNKARDYMFSVWLPNHHLTTEPFMAELYYDTVPEAWAMDIWLKIKPL